MDKAEIEKTTQGAKDALKRVQALLQKGTAEAFAEAEAFLSEKKKGMSEEEKALFDVVVHHGCEANQKDADAFAALASSVLSEEPTKKA